MTPRAPEELEPEDELDDFDEPEVPEDDAVIGRALRRSGAVLVGLALVVAVVVWIATRPEPAPPVREVEVVAPRAVESGGAAPRVAFTDVTAAAGLDFVHESGARGEKLLPETMGGGAAFFDLEGDGDADLLLVNSCAWPGGEDDAPALQALYRNDGSGRFADVTREAGLDLSLYGMGAWAADADGDGDPDLLLTAVGPNRYLRNDGGRFVDATEETGLAGDAGAWSTCAAWFDADRDGDLDLYVGNYVRWSRAIDFEIDYRLTGLGRSYGPPTNFEGAQPYFYRNEGGGRFRECAAEVGLHVENPATGGPIGKALAVHPVDLDRDGWPDLLVANDTVQNFAYLNRGDGTFVERGAELGLAYDREGRATGAMGLDGADFRNDGELGLAIGNFAGEMTSLYVSQGSRALFSDDAIVEGLGRPTRLRLSFGVFFFDYDLDGRLDLLQANGHLENEIAIVQSSQTYAQPAQLFWNAGSAGGPSFVEVDCATSGDLCDPLVGRAATYADVDGDGDLDVLLTQVGGAPRLLRNDQALGHHWLRVRLVGLPGAREAIGARVELTAGGRTQERAVMPFRSYLSQVELPLTFGLGAETRVERLRVTWPDGAAEDVAVEGVDRELVVERRP